MIDIKVGENKKHDSKQALKKEDYSKFNDLKYIQEYIKFYYEKTEQQIKLNKTLLIIAIILLALNLIPSIIKILIFLTII